MVWAFDYQPAGPSFPLAEVAEGNDGELELEDPARDGGAGIVASRSFSGRRVRPESVPRVIRWLSRRPFLDFENAIRKTVSDRFRAIIEELEPGVHQFEPIAFVAKDGSPLGRRWFWQICNRIDSVHRGKTTWVLNRVQWMPPLEPGAEEPRLVFDLARIGSARFWNDKHSSSSNFMSDDAKSRLEAEKITGLRFRHYEQA